MIPLILATLTFTLPLPPQAEELAKGLVLPYRIDGTIAEPWKLRDITLGATSLAYGIGTSHGQTIVEVRIELSEGAAPSIETVWLGQQQPEGAAHAASMLAARVTERFASGEAEIELSAEHLADGWGPDGVSVDGVGVDEEAPDEELRGARKSLLYPLAKAALVLLLVGIVLLRRRLAAALGDVPGWAWVGVGGVTTLSLLLAALLPDVVAYQNGLGHEHARFVANYSEGPFPDINPFGVMQIEVARVFGAAAPLGRESFYASRLALILGPGLLFLFAQALTQRPLISVVAAWLFAILPGWIFVGTSGAATAPGVMLMLAAGWLTVSAARRGDLWLLGLAGLALLILANYRLVGRVAAVPMALSFFAVRAERVPRRWWLWVAGAAAVAVSLSLPHFFEQVRHAKGLFSAGFANPFEYNLLSEPSWTPTALSFSATAGVLVALVGRPWLGVTLLILIGLVLTMTTQSLNLWVNLARYQCWLLPAAALASAILVAALHAALGRRFLFVVTPLAVWLAIGMVQASYSLSEPSPEAQQLQLWRESLEELPEEAVLVLPLEAVGGAWASLPDAEAEGTRPDVTLVSYRDYRSDPEPLGGRPTYWFQPLYCVSIPPDDETNYDDKDCRQVPREERLEPVRVRTIRSDVPARLKAAGVTRLDWTPRQLPDDPVEIGLYRLVPRAGASTAPAAGAASNGETLP